MNDTRASSRRNATRHAPLVALAAFALGGCFGPDSVRDAFARDHSCPPDRVTVVARPDLKPSQIIIAHATPPPEVAADPGRTAVWRENMLEDAAWRDRYGVYEVQGCGVSRVLACGPDRHNSATADCATIGPQPSP